MDERLNELGVRIDLARARHNLPPYKPRTDDFEKFKELYEGNFGMAGIRCLTTPEH